MKNRLVALVVLSGVLHGALLCLAPRRWPAQASPIQPAPVRRPITVRLAPRDALPAAGLARPAAIVRPATHPAATTHRYASHRSAASPPADETAPATDAALPPPVAGALLDAARRDAGRIARELNQEQGAGKALRSERQARIDRDFEEAYAAAHRSLYEDVTTARDGTDQVLRFKTPFGTSVCLWKRDKDRANHTRGQATFLTACNR